MSTQSKIVYIIGPHGVGKSTMIQDISMAQSIQVLDRTRMLNCDRESAFERVSCKQLNYFFEYENHLKIISGSAESYFLGDRCILDSIVYLESFLAMGWVKQHEYDLLKKAIDQLFESFFDQIHKSVFPVLLSADPNWISSKLNERGKGERGVGWQETNDDFLQCLVSKYKDYSQKLGLFKVDTTDRNGRVDQLSDYLKRLNNTE